MLAAVRLASVRAVAQCNPSVACTASNVANKFHTSAPVSIPRDSDFVVARRDYQKKVHSLRKEFIQAGLEEKALQSQQAEEELKLQREEVVARKATKAAQAALNRAASLESQIEIVAAKAVGKRKRRKQWKKRETDLQRMRMQALREDNSGSHTWIHTEEQVDRYITLASLRPYSPSYMWKPLDPTPARLLELLNEEDSSLLG